MAYRYRNLDPAHRPHGPAAILRWGVWEPLAGKRKRTPPGCPAPRVEPDRELLTRPDGPPRLTWLGHAGVVATLAGRHVAIDPLASRRVAGVYRAFVAPALGAGELPELAAVLISHNHYDHLDRRALAAIPRRVPAVVPRGLGRWFARWNPRPVVELAWWQSVAIDGLEVTLVPARHWSRRRPWDTNRSHWGGFVVAGGGVAIYHAGDSAYFAGFAEVGRRFPGLAAALLPVGAYEPAWFMEKNHMNPEQAGRAFLATGARRLVPVHWGMLRLTDERLDEPVARLAAWWQGAAPDGGRRLEVLAVGETLILDGGDA